MIPSLVFIDKTLEYALKNRQMNASDFGVLKKKITDMSKMIYDVPIDAIKHSADLKNMDFRDIRICIEPKMEQVKAARALGSSRVKVLLCQHPDEETALSFSKALFEANRLKMKVTVGSVDISKKSEQRMDFFQKLIKENGIYSIIAADNRGRLDSLTTYRTLEEMKKKIACGIEYEGKNVLALATGNALGAIKSGIGGVAASVGGIGGYPAFEEVLMSAYHLLKMPVTVPENIALRCKDILEYVGIRIPNTKAIIGSNIFAHESGIHVDGVIKKSELYEPFAPEEVGLSRKIVIGKHSGRAAIEQKVKELNIGIKPACTVLLLERVRSLAIKQKAALQDEQLEQLAREVAAYEGACC
jgi:homocitrate synthase NifV